MITEIQVTIKDVYGRPTAYPVNTQAQLLAQMVGTKTLTIETLRQAKAMGFELVEIDRRGNRMPSFADGGHVRVIMARLAA